MGVVKTSAKEAWVHAIDLATILAMFTADALFIGLWAVITHGMDVWVFEEFDQPTELRAATQVVNWTGFAAVAVHFLFGVFQTVRKLTLRWKSVA